MACRFLPRLPLDVHFSPFLYFAISAIFNTSSILLTVVILMEERIDNGKPSASRRLSINTHLPFLH